MLISQNVLKGTGHFTANTLEKQYNLCVKRRKLKFILEKISMKNKVTKIYHSTEEQFNKIHGNLSEK